MIWEDAIVPISTLRNKRIWLSSSVEQWKKDIKAGGEFWARMSLSERKSVIGVLEEIRLEGRTLRQVWEDWKRWKKDNASTTVEPMPYEEVVKE